jgi:hypothetical protein
MTTFFTLPRPLTYIEAAYYPFQGIPSSPLSSDSKYPTGSIASDRGLIAYDPSLDELGSSATPADDDYLHGPDEKHPNQQLAILSFRGVSNVLTLVALIAALIVLFVVYPVIIIIVLEA